MDKLAQLPYLNDCLEEALRIFPPVPIGLLRVVPKGGSMIDGHFIPAGVCSHDSYWHYFRWLLLTIYQYRLPCASAPGPHLTVRRISKSPTRTYLKGGRTSLTNPMSKRLPSLSPSGLEGV